MVRHGGCLGLGLAAMGTHRQDVYEQLKFNLYQDDANTGEAAGIAMGMVMLGSKNASSIEDMVAVSCLVCGPLRMRVTFLTMQYSRVIQFSRFRNVKF